MPSETPPSRVKKAWRRPGMAESSGEPSVMACSALASGFSSLNPASEVRWGSETASTLNIDPMPPRPPPISRFSAPEMSSETSGVAFAIRVDRAGLDAEPLQELALRHRAVDAGADILGGARQRLKIDMGGHVGLAGIFQGIGEAVAGDGLKGIAGVAAQWP